MINSRDINELNEPVRSMAQQFLDKAKEAGIRVIITSTFRDAASQNSLYAQGRTKSGKRVTNASAGQSWHNFRCAFDFVPIVDGRAAWSRTDLFKKLGEIGESIGLEWGGRWTRFVDMPHLQYTGGLTLSQLREKYGNEAPRIP